LVNWSISTPGSGLGWVGSVIWWVLSGWVDEKDPLTTLVNDVTDFHE